MGSNFRLLQLLIVLLTACYPIYKDTTNGKVLGIAVLNNMAVAHAEGAGIVIFYSLPPLTQCHLLKIWSVEPYLTSQVCGSLHTGQAPYLVFS